MSKKLTYFLSFVSMLSLIASVSAQVDPGTANLTHLWTFNNGTANDYVGGANGTLMGSAEIDAGMLMTYNPGSWMAIPADQVAINTYNGITIAAWFASVPDANTAYTMLACFGNTLNSVGVDYYFFTAARGDNISRAAISCGVTSNPWSGETGANGTEYDDGILHHMVSTLSDTDITLYIDGTLSARTTPLAANNNIGLISTAFAALAKSNYTGDSTWIGEIHEFSIYDRVLSADEVLFLYTSGETTSIEEEITSLPEGYHLFQNYPNPFNATTNIRFELVKSSKVNLTVYDLNGREISTLINGVQSPGQHHVQFNAANLSSGVYIYKMVTDNQVLTKKMMLLK